MIEQWFSIPIFYKDLGTVNITEEVNLALEETEINSALDMWNDSVQTSFTYSDNNRFLEKCPTLTSLIYNSVLEYIDTFNFEHDSKIWIEESWVNITERGQYQNHHIHALNDISGVFYYETTGDPDEGNIVFQTPSPVAMNSRLFHNEHNRVYYAPIKGRLILFPSFLEHAVLPNKTDNKRVSISFNANLGDIRPKQV